MSRSKGSPPSLYHANGSSTCHTGTKAREAKRDNDVLMILVQMLCGVILMPGI